MDTESTHGLGGAQPGAQTDELAEPVLSSAITTEDGTGHVVPHVRGRGRRVGNQVGTYAAGDRPTHHSERGAVDDDDA